MRDKWEGSTDIVVYSITGLYGLSVLAGIIKKDYSMPVSLQAAMGTIVTGLFAHRVLRPRTEAEQETINDDKQRNKSRDDPIYRGSNRRTIDGGSTGAGDDVTNTDGRRLESDSDGRGQLLGGDIVPSDDPSAKGSSGSK